MVGRILVERKRRREPTSKYIALILLLGLISTIGFAVGRVQRAPAKVEKERAFVAEYNVIEIPVPERPVPAGTMVRDIVVRSEKFPEHQLPRDAVKDLALFQNEVTLVALPGGLPIIATNLGSVSETENAVIGKIPPGMRAITVRVDATASVEGWARTGSAVDVLLVEKSRTTVVAENVRILSTERSTSPVEDQPGSPLPGTVTLLVSQEQCLAISTAVPLGKIAFALRSKGDKDNWRNTQFSANELLPDRRNNPKSKVGGIVTFKSGSKSQQFALVDGIWIPTDVVPQGFLMANRDVADGSAR